MTVLGPREAYRRLAQDYDGSPNALIALEERTMLPLLPCDLTGQTVADAAGGTGRWSAHCRRRGAFAIAFDLCHEMLRSTPAVQADAARMPLRDGAADVVICAFALGYAPACFAELARITRPGGTVLVSDIHPEALRRGWTRTFRSRGEVIRVADEPYTIADLHAPGLELSCVLEPRLGDPEREIFERAGRIDLYEAACREPAIFVARWRRQ
jgi:malonyl-CoA O-methyltransferase